MAFAYYQIKPNYVQTLHQKLQYFIHWDHSKTCASETLSRCNDFAQSYVLTITCFPLSGPQDAVDYICRRNIKIWNHALGACQHSFKWFIIFIDR